MSETESMKLINRMYPCKDCGNYGYFIEAFDVWGVRCFGCDKIWTDWNHLSKQKAGQAWNDLHKPRRETRADKVRRLLTKFDPTLN